MITSIDQQQRERLKTEAQQSAHQALADPGLPGVLESFIQAGQVFLAMGRLVEARTAAMTGMEIGLRLHYQSHTGSLLCGDVGRVRWAHRMRSLGLLDRASLQTIVEVCSRVAPYDDRFIDELLILARAVVAAVLEPQQREATP